MSSSRPRVPLECSTEEQLIQEYRDNMSRGFVVTTGGSELDIGDPCQIFLVHPSTGRLHPLNATVCSKSETGHAICRLDGFCGERDAELRDFIGIQAVEAANASTLGERTPQDKPTATESNANMGVVLQPLAVVDIIRKRASLDQRGKASFDSRTESGTDDESEEDTVVQAEIFYSTNEVELPEMDHFNGNAAANVDTFHRSGPSHDASEQPALAREIMPVAPEMNEVTHASDQGVDDHSRAMKPQAFIRQSGDLKEREEAEGRSDGSIQQYDSDEDTQVHDLGLISEAIPIFEDDDGMVLESPNIDAHSSAVSSSQNESPVSRLVEITDPVPFIIDESDMHVERPDTTVDVTAIESTEFSCRDTQPMDAILIDFNTNWLSNTGNAIHTTEEVSAEHDSAEEKRREKPPANIKERIRGLPHHEVLRLARSGQIAERKAVEKIYGKAVWQQLLRNPGLTPPEVARIARMGDLPKPLIATIVNHTGWISKALIRRALLSNPRLTGQNLIRVLKAIPRSELKLVPSQTVYPYRVREAAKKILQ